MKRLRFALLLLVVLGNLSASAAPAPASVGFRGDAQGRGVAPGRLPRRRPRALWTVRTEGPIHGTPLWAGDRIYFGSGDGRLQAADARSGRLLWTAATGGAVDGSPVLADGLVVVASRDRVLRAFDSASGSERWRFAFGEDLPFKWGWDFFLSSAVVAEGRLFVGAGDGRVYALDAKTGREAWRFATGGRVRSSPVVAGGVVYVGSCDGHVYGLDAASGKEVWRFSPEGTTLDNEKFGFDRRSVQGSPTVAGDAIVVGSRDGHFYAAERTTGKKRWSIDHEVSWVVGTPAFDSGIAYVGSSDGHFVQAVDVASGKELWRHPVGFNVLSSPLLVSGTLLFGCMDGALYAVDAKTGRELWRHRTNESILASPVVKDGVVLLASADGTLTALAGDLDTPVITADRAVFADPDAPWRWLKSDREVRDGLVREGYAPLDATALETFLEVHTKERSPSVVVIAGGNVPPGIEGDGTASAPVRRYLEAGGRIVWLGGPPFAVVLDPKTNQPVKFDGKKTEAILGVAFKGMGLGEARIAPTKLGASVGLPSWWVGDVSVHPEPGMEVLAADGDGRASIWMKRYGEGGAGRFVYLWGRDHVPPPTSLVVAAAEYELR